MGSFSPTDAPTGFLLYLPKKEGAAPVVLIDQLQRPVHTSFADFDENGLDDFVICEFAKWTGNLSWWQNKGKGRFERRLLTEQTGAIKTAVRDFNEDGRTDILALFGQGNEGFFVYLNQGNGQFQERQILQFPASYGSSYFELTDFNGDGNEDIIYTNGDNADYPPILKPYHGIRVFLNEGNLHFKESLFIPLPGAYAAMPRDYDKDGDLDFAAISFFPDFEETPAKSFAYFENTGNLTFKAYTFPEVNNGRWLVMDAGDMDQDGDTDLILGALTFETVPDVGLVDRWTSLGLPFVILRNQTIGR